MSKTKSSEEGHRLHWDTALRDVAPRNLPTDKTNKVRNWEIPKVLSQVDLTIYTDGSKEENRVGCGWAACIEDQVIYEEYRFLGQDSTVFQAEVIAISDCLRWMLRKPPKLAGVKYCLIRSDSASAISAIFSETIESLVVLDCVNTLHEVNKHFEVAFDWVKGHSDQTGNEFADYLAKEGNRQTVQACEPIIPVPMATIKSRIADHICNKWQTRWNSSQGRRVSKHFFPRVDGRKWKRLCKLQRRDLNLLFQAGMGHGLFRGHIAKWTRVHDSSG